jgi:hypothetical protein
MFIRLLQKFKQIYVPEDNITRMGNFDSAVHGK